MAQFRFPHEGSISEFLGALTSPEETHGAVSVSAVAGGMGTAMLLMVAALPQTRPDSVDDQAVLVSAAAALSRVQQELLETIETETAVKLFVARSMPQASQVQRDKRESAIQVALRSSAEVPLEVMRLCAVGLKHAETVARRSPRAASAEVELAAALLFAGFNGARSNLEAKLSSLTDTMEVTSIADEIAGLSDEAAASAAAVKALIGVPPA